MLIQLLANGIIMGSIYSLVALGFALVYNTTRIFHIAYAAIYMFASYMILSFYKALQLPLLLAFLIAIVFTVGLSILIERTVYLPLAKRKSSLNVVLISSIGIMIVVVNTIAMFYGNETQILNPNISKSVTLGSIILTHTQIAQLFVSLLLIGIFLIFLKYSKFGIKTRAMRDDDVLCTVFGLDINRMRLNLFGLSAFFAAIGSGLVALIIGGVGRFEAPILGGFIIGILQSLAVWVFSSRWQDAVTFTLLILFLLLRPQGLLGEKQRVV